MYNLILREMENDILLEENEARVLDLLEQIRRVNKMVDLHRDSGITGMQSQYEDIRDRFLAELKEILSQYELEVLLKKSDTAA